MENNDFLTFRGRPLVRQGNIIFFGDLNEKYYVMLTVMDTHPMQDLQISGKVEAQLLLTDKNIPAKQALIKKAVRDGLYQAMDLAVTWLDMANAEE